jgi:hypothetical protein
MSDPRELRRAWVPGWTRRRWIRWRYLWFLPTRLELQAAWLDLQAWRTGWCNHCPHRDPSEPEGSRGNGYAFWRCEKPAGHVLPHRFRSYRWYADRRVAYDPVPQDMPHSRVSPWSWRHIVPSWRYRMRGTAIGLAGEIWASRRVPEINPAGE